MGADQCTLWTACTVECVCVHSTPSCRCMHSFVSTVHAMMCGQLSSSTHCTQVKAYYMGHVESWALGSYLRKTSSRPSVRARTRATGRASFMLKRPSMVSLAIFTMSTADLHSGQRQAHTRYQAQTGSVIKRLVQSVKGLGQSVKTRKTSLRRLGVRHAQSRS